MKAWHFSEESRLLRYGDNRKIAPGKTHKVDCEPRLCKRGLHASVNIMDALDFAPGPILWRVELGGKIVKGNSKVCATERTYLYGVDATQCLREFARKCALDVIHLWDAPEVVVRYLKTGDESLRDSAMAAARDAAAWDASARAAVRDAAWAAAMAAVAMDSAMDAARDAARAAAMDAAAWAAAMAAAREKQSRRLLAMVRKLPRITA